MSKYDPDQFDDPDEEYEPEDTDDPEEERWS